MIKFRKKKSTQYSKQQILKQKNCKCKYNIIKRGYIWHTITKYQREFIKVSYSIINQKNWGKTNEKFPKNPISHRTNSCLLALHCLC